MIRQQLRLRAGGLASSVHDELQAVYRAYQQMQPMCNTHELLLLLLVTVVLLLCTQS